MKKVGVVSVLVIFLSLSTGVSRMLHVSAECMICRMILYHSKVRFVVRGLSVSTNCNFYMVKRRVQEVKYGSRFLLSHATATGTEGYLSTCE